MIIPFVLSLIMVLKKYYLNIVFFWYEWTNKKKLKLKIPQLLDKYLKIWFVTYLALTWGVCIWNFTSLALKLREEFEDDGWTYCKNAKFQIAWDGTKILLMIIAKLPFSRGISKWLLQKIKCPDPFCHKWWWQLILFSSLCTFFFLSWVSSKVHFRDLSPVYIFCAFCGNLGRG